MFLFFTSTISAPDAELLLIDSWKIEGQLATDLFRDTKYCDLYNFQGERAKVVRDFFHCFYR